MLDDADTDDAGAMSYLSIFKNRGKAQVWVRGRDNGGYGKGTNSMSGRKRASIPIGCEYNKAVETDHIVDIHPESYYRYGTVCLKYSGMNTQIHGPPGRIKWPSGRPCTPKLKEIRCIDLPLIHHNLWIADINSIQYCLPRQPVVIINVSDIQIHDERQLYHIPCLDTKTVHFRDFYQSFLNVKDLLDEHLSSKAVIIVCQAGVNRSSAMAVAYAISNGLKCNDIIEYLADRKFTVSPNWDNLTNMRFRTILRQLQSRSLKI